MKIKRTLNNNAAIAENHDGVDVLVMGPGIAFGKKLVTQLRLQK
ncbi:MULTISPECIES: CAT RNA binding domain-containing protein [Liquorilactobacillus]